MVRLHTGSRFPTHRNKEPSIMDILIFALIVLIVCAMLIYAVNYIAPGAPFDKLIICLLYTSPSPRDS